MYLCTFMQVMDEINRLAAAFIGLQRSVEGSSFEAVSDPQQQRKLCTNPVPSCTDTEGFRFLTVHVQKGTL